VPTAFVEAEPN